MADNKYERYVQLFPKTFRPQDGDEVLENLPADATTGKTISQLWNENVANPVLNAVLRGFAQGDLDVSTALEATKASLFVKTAENQQLDVIASSLGVSRPGSLGLSDSAFQNLVPPLSLGAKQVRSAFYNAMDAFYGPEFSRANLVTVNTTTSLFDLRLDDSLSFIVDDGETQTITIRTTSGIANLGQALTPGQATALELNNLIKDNLTGVTSEILTDPITKIETVRVLTTTPGLRGSLEFSISRDDLIVNQSRAITVLINSLNPPDHDPNTQVLLLGDFTNGELLVGDVVTFRVAGNEFKKEITFIDPNTTTNHAGIPGPATIISIENIPPTGGVTTSEFIDFAASDLIFVERDIPRPVPEIFPLEKAELLKQDQRTAVYEITPNNVIIELPAVLPSLQRGLKGALHVHNGPLLNNLIFRGEETDYLLPDALFENNPNNLYTVTGNLPFTYEPVDVVNTIPITRTRTIRFQPASGQDIDVYEFTVTNTVDTTQVFTFFVRVDNRIAPAADQQIWEGAFIFDPNGTQTAFTVSGESAVITGDAITGATTLAAGRVFPRVNVEAETNNLPDESGFAVIGFGSETQEPALIRYRGKASSSIIELDPSFVFTRNQPAGTYINIVSSPTPFIPDRIGSDYPIYLTSSTEARIVVQDILQSLAAAGVVVTFVVLAPEYKYLIDNPYLTTDDAPIV